MPALKRFKTKYPGVIYIEGTSSATGKKEKIYYITYRLNGKLIEEKAGRQYQDNMTPAKASLLRSKKINGEIPPNKIKREEKNKKEWTLDNLFEKYRLNKPTLRCLRDDIYRYNNYVRDVLGDKLPSQITPHDIDKLRLDLSKKLKPQTVKHALTQIRRIINYGVSRNLCIGLNFKIEMPKINNLKTEDLSTKQLQRLLHVLDEDPNSEAANLMKLALFTGMRKSEILRLTWDDVDFEKRFIHIRNPKGGIDQKIPLNISSEKVIKVISKKYNSKYIFPGKNGSLRDRTSFTRPINRIKKKAKLPEDFRPIHGLRHVYASMLASSGKVDMYTLQKLLTHKSPEMTQRYAHLRDEALKKASNITDEIIIMILNNSEK